MQTTRASDGIEVAELDRILAKQIAVAWAGESGESVRLGWWRTDLASEFGGEDLFRRLLPNTWRWAVLEGAREAARRRDEELRIQDADPDRLITLYRLGFELDERLSDRLADLKRTGAPPIEALPQLRDLLGDWSKPKFVEWVRIHGEAAVVSGPKGRRLKGAPPGSIARIVDNLVAALDPLPEAYPMPHYRSAE